jgi:C4-dicarboxylate transporter
MVVLLNATFIDVRRSMEYAVMVISRSYVICMKWLRKAETENVMTFLQYEVKGVKQHTELGEGLQ